MDTQRSVSKRDALIKALTEDVSTFVNTFYFEKNGLYSPYITVGNRELVNLIGTQRSSDFEVVSLTDPNISLSDTPSVNLDKLQKFKTQMESCLFVDTFESRVYLRSDGYTNNLLISYLLSYIYDNLPVDSGMKGIRFLYDSTIYNSPSGTLGLNLYGDGIKLSEYLSDISNFNIFHNIDIFDRRTKKSNRTRVLNQNFILDLLKQILVNLQMLQEKYLFNHGELTRDKILISKNPVTIRYSTIRTVSDITFKIADFRYSSMNLKLLSGTNIRLSRENVLAQNYLQVVPFEPTIDKSLNQSYYILDNLLNAQMLADIRYTGIQFYSSFDTITLILSLLMLPEVYYEVFTNSLLKNIIWSTLWHPKDESLAFEQLTKIVVNPKSEGTYDDILDLLRGKWIKCGLTDELVINLSRSYNVV